ncbi:MAG TPA: hypothetical protein PKI71_11060 [Candidatus Rifleibacterium sp.]|jgi:hypothetical protein|nr:hypothetical protein [Candidatus Rifleibacterium sp.]
MDTMNTTTVVTVKMSLSRWLKADERLAEVLKEMAGRINQGSNLRVEKVLGPTQYETMAKQIQAYKADIQAFMRLQDERIRIRSEVAGRNAVNGVNLKLARVSMLQQRVELFKRILQQQIPDMIALEEFREMTEKKRNQPIGFGKPAKPADDTLDYEEQLFRSICGNGGYGAKDGLAVRMLSSEEVDQLKAQVQSTELEIFELKNEIAESNIELLAIDLPVEVAGYFRKI